MYRYISWLAVGSAAVFLLVAQASFPPVTVAWLALAITAGTLAVSTGIAYACRKHIASLVTALVIAGVSGWTVVASLVFSPSTAQNLAFAGALAIAGLATVGLTAHELSHERIGQSVADPSSESEPHLSAAA